MSRLLVVVALASILPATVFAKTIRVPADEATIVRAVFVAQEGDTVSVAPGTYRERITILSKNIVLRGEAGADATVIDGSISKGNVITLGRVGRDMILEDLTITGGSLNREGMTDSLGSGIFIHRGHPTIRRCTLVENDAVAAGSLVGFFFCRPLIEDCLITRNRGGGIFLETGSGEEPGGLPEDKAQIINTTISNNLGHGISVIRGAQVEVIESTISHNSGHGVRAEMTPGTGGGRCWLTVKNSQITNNQAGGISRSDLLVCYTLQCNNVWSNPVPNAPEDYVGNDDNDPCFRGRGFGSVSVDPMYVDPAGNDFRLQQNSPLFSLCVPNNCGAIGANTECPVGVVDNTTWGVVKSLYR